MPNKSESSATTIDSLAEVTVFSIKPIYRSYLTFEMKNLCRNAEEIFSNENEVLMFFKMGVVSIDINNKNVDSIFALKYNEWTDSIISSSMSYPISYTHIQKKSETYSMAQHYKSTNRFNYLISYDSARNWDTLYHNGYIEFINMYDKNNFIGISSKPNDSSRFHKVFKTKNAMQTIDSLDMSEKINMDKIANHSKFEIKDVHFGNETNHIYVHFLGTDYSEINPDSILKYQSYMASSTDNGENWELIEYPINFKPVFHYNSNKIIRNDTLFIIGNQFSKTDNNTISNTGYIKLLKHVKNSNKFELAFKDTNQLNVEKLSNMNNNWFISNINAPFRPANLIYSIDNGKNWKIAKNSVIQRQQLITQISFMNENEFFFYSYDKELCRAKIKNTSSVNDYESNSFFSIHPNPASDYIEISFSNKGLQPFANSEEFAIYDVLGERVAQTFLSVKSTSAPSGHLRQRRTQRIDISHLPRGVYFVRIGERVEKFVKE